MRNYEPIPDFGEYIEYISQAAPVQQGDDTYYGLGFYHSPITRHELLEGLTLREVLENYIKVFRILSRVLDLELSELNTAIPAGVRSRINAWLSGHGWPTIPSGWTYKQLLVAVKERV